MFLTPDRTDKERAKHQQLVLQLKEKTFTEPNRRHFNLYQGRGDRECGTENEQSANWIIADNNDCFDCVWFEFVLRILTWYIGKKLVS